MLPRANDAVVDLWAEEVLSHRSEWRHGVFVEKVKVDHGCLHGFEIAPDAVREEVARRKLFRDDVIKLCKLEERGVKRSGGWDGRPPAGRRVPDAIRDRRRVPNPRGAVCPPRGPGFRSPRGSTPPRRSRRAPPRNARRFRPEGAGRAGAGS